MIYHGRRVVWVPVIRVRTGTIGGVRVDPHVYEYGCDAPRTR